MTAILAAFAVGIITGALTDHAIRQGRSNYEQYRREIGGK